MTFVPLPYLYPSQGGWLNRLTIVLSLPWMALLALTLWLAEAPVVSQGCAAASLYFPAWYLGASWWPEKKSETG